jgi:hypothetical protein
MKVRIFNIAGHGRNWKRNSRSVDHNQTRASTSVSNNPEALRLTVMNA